MISIAELRAASGLPVQAAPTTPIQAAPAAPIQAVSALHGHIEYAGKLMSYCSGFAVIEDIARPLAPFPIYSMLGGLLVIALSFPAARTLSSFGINFSKLRSAMAVIATISAGLIALEGTDPSIAQHGMLASKFTAAAEMQKALIGIDKHLVSIEVNTKQTVEKIDALRTAVKQETSVDPRKELANLGVKWEQKSFIEAEQTGDVRTMKLLLDGGMRPANGFFMNFVRGRLSDEIAKLYFIYHVFDAPDTCPPIEGNISIFGGFYQTVQKDPVKAKFVRQVCGGKTAFRQELEDQVRHYELRIDNINIFNANRNSIISKCVSDLRAKYTPQTLSHAATILGHDQRASSADELLKDRAWRAPGHTIDSSAMDGYIKYACEDFNSPKNGDYDLTRLNFLKDLRRAFLL